MNKQCTTSMHTRFGLIGSLLLALLVAYLSVGLPVMHCLHSQTTSAYLGNDDCCSDTGEKTCCPTDNDCMSIGVARLAPTLVAANATPTLAPLWIDLPHWQLFMSACVTLCMQCSDGAWCRFVPFYGIISSPRTYLLRLSVLII
ncbi:MAG: hypothetical protein Q4A44_01050 [Bacteroidales bacterium]|nr:hypothetical protein [Bacteroidales bacterium]